MLNQLEFKPMLCRTHSVDRRRKKVFHHPEAPLADKPQFCTLFSRCHPFNVSDEPIVDEAAVERPSKLKLSDNVKHRVSRAQPAPLTRPALLTYKVTVLRARCIHGKYVGKIIVFLYMVNRALK